MGAATGVKCWLRPPRVMMAFAHRRAAVLVLAGVVGLAVVGWVAARQIRSPAQVAADTAPPRASAITVPVRRRSLATQVIVRGTVRYGAPQPVVLATSGVKGAATKQTSSDIVTTAPVKGAKLTTGDVVMTVDGRPVFALPGVVPMHRDLAPGDDGPDVGQLEQALARHRLRSRARGRPLRRRDRGRRLVVLPPQGWDPFGATDTQLDALRTAEAAAAAARDAHLQALTTIEQAKQTPGPGRRRAGPPRRRHGSRRPRHRRLAVGTAARGWLQARASAARPEGRGAPPRQRRDQAARRRRRRREAGGPDPAIDAVQIAR